ncbi:hypothetical protein Sjap_024839 [Stephania japonica]|uniref:Uncharacterized protein n=1 Tax=Stephania japonica TaxID=461633 RepID=A0AAP0HP41_9MAGN
MSASLIFTATFTCDYDLKVMRQEYYIGRQKAVCKLAKSTNISFMARTLEFSATVGEPQLLRLDTPCPREFKYLSNIDDQIGLRNHIPFVHFYPPSKVMNNSNNSSGDSNRNKDIVEAIRMGVSKALVHYYPIAGRLRNGENGKLIVDCCGEGVIFREADANVTLEELQKISNGGLKPPFPQWEKLLVDDVWGCNFITDSPLLRMQVHINVLYIYGLGSKAHKELMGRVHKQV